MRFLTKYVKKITMSPFSLPFLFLLILGMKTGYGQKLEDAIITTTLPGSYESLWDLSPFSKEKRFKVKAECYGDKDPEEKLCIKVLRPGLPLFSSGAIPSFFPLSKEEGEAESSRCFQKLFDWGDCKDYEERDFKIHGPGDEDSFGSIVPVPPIHNWFDKEDDKIQATVTRITPSHLRNLMTSEDVSWASSNLPFVYDLPFFEYERGEDALHVNVYKKLVDLDISPNVTPDPGAKTEYESLPEEFKGHVKEYYRFISKYGTHLKSGGTLGARWTALFSPVSYELFNSLRLWKKRRNMQELDFAATMLVGTSVDPKCGFILENRTQVETRSLFKLQGGELIENFREMERLEIFKSWLGTIYGKPNIIYTNFTAINNFLDSPASKRYHSFKEMIKCEEAHNILRKIIFQFSSVVTAELNYLARYLLKAIEKEANLICPSEGLQTLLEDGILAEKNIDLEKFTLELIKEPQFNYKNQTTQRKGYKLPLIPGICFNFGVKLRNIEGVETSFPKNVNCYSVYKNKGCKGERFDVFNEEELKNVIGFAGSISFCPVCIKKQSLL